MSAPPAAASTTAARQTNPASPKASSTPSPFVVAGCAVLAEAVQRAAVERRLELTAVGALDGADALGQVGGDGGCGRLDERRQPELEAVVDALHRAVGFALGGVQRHAVGVDEDGADGRVGPGGDLRRGGRSGCRGVACGVVVAAGRDDEGQGAEAGEDAHRAHTGPTTGAPRGLPRVETQACGRPTTWDTTSSGTGTAVSMPVALAGKSNTPIISCIG